MKNQQLKLNLNLFFRISFVLFTVSLSILAQSTKEEKVQIKKFGSSLKKNSDKSSKRQSEKKQSDVIVEEAIRIDTNLFVSDFLVVDKQGYAVTGLKKEDFIVKEDEQLQKIEIFSAGDNLNLPRSIVLMIDLSGMPSVLFGTSLDGAKVLIDKLNPKDRVAIVTDEIKLIQPFTEDKELLKKKIDSLKRNLGLRENTFQYETLLAVLNELVDADGKTRPIIIAQTLGDTLFLLKQTEANLRPPLAASMIKKEPRIISWMENMPRRDLSYDEVYLAAERSKATIYTVIPTLSLIGHSQEEQIKRTIKIYEESFKDLKMRPHGWGRGELKSGIREEPLDQQIYYTQGLLKKQVRLGNLAQITGGWVDFLETPEHANEVYSRIFSDIKQRYTIGYYSTNETKEEKRRMIKVEVKNHSEYRVLGRKTYLSTINPNARN